MQRSAFHFDLPAELIAQRPPEARAAGRLLVLDGASGSRTDGMFRDLPSLLNRHDLVVFNDSKVVPARMRGVKASGGRIEMLLERALDATTALVHARSGKSLKPGALITLPGGATARMLGREGDLFRMSFSGDVLGIFEQQGEMPLPPYIDREPENSDRDRYQTVFAREPGAVAAPTAGLHFDEETLAALAARGVARAFVTLHVGAGTFQPLRVDDIDAHVMHEEVLDVPQATCDAVNAARAAGGRIVAVGTTVVRSLETAAAAHAAHDGDGAAERDHGDATAEDRVDAAALDHGNALRPFRGVTRMFIRPGHRFRVVDALLTNFHLPESTLLMLCAAFAGRETLLAAYAHAVRSRYRFFSYGDAMFLTPERGARESD